MKYLCWAIAIWLGLLGMVGLVFAEEKGQTAICIAPLDQYLMRAEDTVGEGNRVFIRTYEVTEDGGKYAIQVATREGSVTSYIKAEAFCGNLRVLELHLRKSPDAYQECKKVGELLKLAKASNLKKVVVYKRDNKGAWLTKEFVEDPTAPLGGDIEREAQKALR